MTRGPIVAPRLRRGQLLALAAAFSYALQNLAMRAAGPTVDPFLVTLFAGLPTLVASLWMTVGRASGRANLAAFWRVPGGPRLFAGLAGAGIVMYAVGNPLFVRALAAGGATVATPCSNTVVLWSALLAAVFLGESLDRRALTGVGLFVAGVTLLSWGQGSDVPVGPAWFWALPLGTGAGLCWSFGVVGIRYALRRGQPVFAILATFGLAGLGVVLALVLATGSLAAFLRSAVTRPDVLRSLTLMLLAGLLNLAAQVTLTLAYATETVAGASVISSSSVAIVAVLARLFLGETLNGVMFTGVVGTFAGAVLVQGGPGRERLPVTGSPRLARP